MADPDEKIVYFDANATTLMPQAVVDSMLKWCNRGNPSAEYESAREARRMMDTFRREIAAECRFDLEGPDGYAVIFTSGASESNCHIVTSAVRAYLSKTKRLPHLITSAVEHKSLLLCCQRLKTEGLCDLTILPVRQFGPDIGTVDPEDVRAALRPNTCLVTIMMANNESGIINNVKDVAKIAHGARVPFHTDAVQLFGKLAIHPSILGIDAFSVSFHKIHGPPGSGLLVIKRRLIEGYNLCAHICGTQNDGLRGGTENLPGIAASFTAFRYVLADRDAKMDRVRHLRNMIKAALSKYLPCFYLDEHPSDVRGATPVQSHNHGSDAARRAIARSDDTGAPIVFWIAPTEDWRLLPNTLLLAVRRPGFCNHAAREALERRNVIVGLGSACNSDSGASSGVIVALNVPVALRPGVIRVSLSDDTTTDDVKRFVHSFLTVVTSDECLEKK